MSEDRKKDIAQIEQRLKEIKAEKEKLLQEAASIDGQYLNSYEIRPASRHVLTIGEGLIQDQYAAIVELVKNSYDADSSDVLICFKKIHEKCSLEISIEDHGHGMSANDVIFRWLVPSTTYKSEQRKSPSGRTMQGRKGIGRYAASILGDDLLLETIDTQHKKTTLYIVWKDFLRYKYLDQIDIPIQTAETNQNSGTRLLIRSSLSDNLYWCDEALSKLRYELKKLIPPQVVSNTMDRFSIRLRFENFYDDDSKNTEEEIAPYPILDLFDYRISGQISSDGKGSLKYENQKIKNGTIEEVPFTGKPTGCGSLNIDVRVYDRDKDAIDQLILRGLKDTVSGQYVSKLQARQLLNDVNGLGVYRNGFRIRPLGDADFDWLKLNEQRIQNPSLRIGSNQVVGYVHVESEEISGLEEKSARDGLKSNQAYDNLKRITLEVIAELEKRRYIYRRKLDLSNPKRKVEKQLDRLYDYSSLKKSISITLKKAGLSDAVMNEVAEIITKEEYQKNEAVDEIRQAIATYQGQATLGKIVNIILHEGRRPLNYFRNQIPNLVFYDKRFAEKRDPDSATEIVRLTQGIAENASIFVGLFGRLDPLSAKRRETKAVFLLTEALHGVAAVFQKECEKEKISVEVCCPDGLEFYGWKQDIYTIFANLFDNSIYWIVEKNCRIRNISINATEYGDRLIVEYRDSGPGINADLLESGIIFDPQFSTKPQGTGLGLSIAGEAAARNGLNLTAVYEEDGAHFRLSTE